MMEQIPGFTRLTRFPLTVQTAVVVEEKVTGSPDDAVADTSTGPWPYGILVSGPNAMVCAATDAT